MEKGRQGHNPVSLLAHSCYCTPKVSLENLEAKPQPHDVPSCPSAFPRTPGLLCYSPLTVHTSAAAPSISPHQALSPAKSCTVLKHHLLSLLPSSSLCLGALQDTAPSAQEDSPVLLPSTLIPEQLGLQVQSQPLTLLTASVSCAY